MTMRHPNHSRMPDMNPTRKTIAAALLAACCATTFAAGQLETPPADGGQDTAQGREGRGPGPGR